ncbi:MAG: hypothetical protein MUO63_19475 [Desulfobulbaceae bacterium]|nr:hypothetical protein [Desulfobulbaceae bacterium]
MISAELILAEFSGVSDESPSFQLDDNSGYRHLLFSKLFLLHEEVIWQDLKWFRTGSDRFENEIGELSDQL